MRRVEGLDAMRSAAIILVLASHSVVFFLGGLLPRLLRWEKADYLAYAAGYAGVEVFFALSGFLIGGILLRSWRGGESGWVRRFWVRRWFRTLPNYYLFLALNLALGLGLGMATPTLIPHLVFAQSLIVDSADLLFRESWSLAVEEWFYFIAPLLLVSFAAIVKSKAMVATSLTLICLSTAGRLAYAAVQPAHLLPDYITFLHLDSIGIGVYCAWIARNGWPKWTLSPILPLLGTVLGVVGAAVWIRMQVGVARGFESHVLSAFVYTFTSLGAASWLPTLSTKKLWSGPAKFAGAVSRISYSTYLCNVPLALLILNTWPAQGLMDGAVRFFIWLAGVALISWATYTFFEAPILRYRDQRFLEGRPPWKPQPPPG